MSTLRGVETFDFLLKHDNAQKKRRKVIRVVVIIVVVLILLIGGAVLLKSFVIDPITNDSNDSTRPPYKPNDTLSDDRWEQNSDISQESSVCKVIQNQDEKLTPCSFPFVIAGQTFYNCTGK